MDNSIKDEVIARITPKKIQHTYGCIKAGRELAEKWGENVENCENAMLFHDITKHYTKEEQLNACEKYGIIVDEIEKTSYKLLHAKTASEVARQEYKMNDEVADSIKYHTTLRGNMKLIDKIVYLADYIEENRDFEGVEEARRLAFIDIDEALIYCLDSVILDNMKKGYLLHPDTINARNELYKLKRYK